MNEFVLHAPTARTRWRWAGSALTIVAIHVGLIAAGIAWYQDRNSPGAEMPAIMVDMAPATAAPQSSQQDIAPGPEMEQATEQSAPPEEVQPPPPQVVEEIAATPPVEKPVVEAPPEQKTEPTPPPPEPVKAKPEPPKPVEKPKPKPVVAEVKKKRSDKPAAPRTTAPTPVDRQAAAASAASAGAAASAAAMPAYNSRLRAHLQRYKEYPEEARSGGKTGLATVTVTISRSGQVLSSRLSGSSGVPALDAAAMATVRRAQPLPAFPPEMTMASQSFAVPIRFNTR